MNNEQWRTCNDALDMLENLRASSLQKWKSLAPDLQRYFLECCKEIDHLLPQEHIQRGLEGAQNYLNGKISLLELERLEWHAEAEAFAIDYQIDSAKVRNQIESTEELRDLTYEDAWRLIKTAAYFANRAICNSYDTRPLKLPRNGRFLCPNLLRRMIPAPFDS